MHLEYYIITNMRSQNAFLYPFWGDDDDDYFPAMLDSVMKGLQWKSYYYYYYYMLSSANAV